MKILALLALCGGIALGQNSTDYVNPDNYPNPFAVCGDTSGKGAFERNYRGDEPISIGLTPPDRNRPDERLSPVIDGLLEDSVWSYSDTMGVSNLTKMFSILQGGTNLCIPEANGEYRFNGARDFFAVWRYMYNRDGLYIGIQVHDDIIDTLYAASPWMKDGVELGIDPSDWGLYDLGQWDKGTDMFTRYLSNNGSIISYPNGSEKTFIFLGKEFLGQQISCLYNTTIKQNVKYHPDSIGGIQIASAHQGVDQWGRQVIHTEIKIPFHSGIWSSLDSKGYFDADGLPREGQRFKMSFQNNDNDSSNGTITTGRNSTFLSTRMSDIFHDVSYTHWSDTRYMPTYIFSRSVISGVRPIIGTISSAKNELSNAKDVDFTINITPNPFNPSTKISVGNLATPVMISIYDITGKCVANFNAIANSSVTWNAKGFSSGFYLVTAKSANKTISKRILLSR